MVVSNYRDLLIGNLLIVFVFLTVAYMAGTGLEQQESACLFGKNPPIEVKVDDKPEMKTFCRGLVDTAWAYSLMTIGVGLYTFFSLLSLPLNKVTSISGEQVRFAITVTLVVVFIVYYGTVGYWSDEEGLGAYGKELMGALSSLLAIVIPFYFGAGAAIEISEKKNSARLADDDRTRAGGGG
jgi:hypothetical protein